jgi:hypothetical protein
MSKDTFLAQLLKKIMSSIWSPNMMVVQRNAWSNFLFFLAKLGSPDSILCRKSHSPQKIKFLQNSPNGQEFTFSPTVPSVVLVQTQQEACSRSKIYIYTTFCTNYAVWEWV